MDDFEIKNHAYSLLEELLSYGVSVDTIERALKSAIAEDRKQLQKAAAQEGLEGLSEVEKLEVSRNAAHQALEAAEKHWARYVRQCEGGPERTRALAGYENIRAARRI